MEAPLQAQYGAPLEPLGHPTNPLSHTDPVPPPSLMAGYPHGSQLSLNGTSIADGADTPGQEEGEGEEEECLVDSQPICFQENPFLVANRKGKGRPAGEQVLSGPPVGYGKQGQLQPWLFSKASSTCLSVFGSSMACSSQTKKRISFNPGRK